MNTDIKKDKKGKRKMKISNYTNLFIQPFGKEDNLE
jgi:hypothetical protein